ncbi:MAG: cytochrome c biogenesis protein CcsA [Phycisphaerae bacterium]|nr:cytochrome c biogenesis protein CcsA [Phycisphaerae bacterium]
MHNAAADKFGLKAWPYGPILVAAIALFALAGVIFVAVAILRFNGRTRPAVALRWLAELLFLAGSALIGGLWVYRWRHVQHLPLQNMFEIFLSMGMLMYPLSLFCRGLLGAKLPYVDCVLGIVLALPAAYINVSSFSATPKTLMPALRTWLFGPHVLSYMLSYVILFMAAAHAVVLLVLSVADAARGKESKSISEFDGAAYRVTLFGYPLLTLGLVLGSVWGKVAWGDYWFWDPKEMWSLVSWLVFLGYFHFRHMFPRRYRAITAAWSIAGAAAIVVTLMASIVSALSGASMHAYVS